MIILRGMYTISAPRISRETCRGIHYVCMFCKQSGEDVIWEYDEDARQVVAVTCADVVACADRQAEVAIIEGYG